MKKVITALLLAFTISSSFIGCVSKNKQDKPSQGSTQTSVDLVKESAAEEQKGVNKDEALNKVIKLLGEQPKGFSVVYDHEESKEGKEFYVIHHFETVTDNADTGEGHNTTVGWYYVDKSKGDVYKWNDVEDILNKLN